MREVKPTQKPVPSSDIKDLFFNSGLVDQVVTSSNHFYVDRFGVEHYTIDGINHLSKQAMLNYGYITKRSFESGNTIINPNDVLLWESNGEYYRWDGELPKVVSAGSTPESAGGIGDSKWKSIGDSSLRNDIEKYKYNNEGASIYFVPNVIVDDLSIDNRDPIYSFGNDIYIPEGVTIRCNLLPDDDVTIFKGEGKILTRDPWGNEHVFDISLANKGSKFNVSDIINQHARSKKLCSVGIIGDSITDGAYSKNWSPNPTDSSGNLSSTNHNHNLNGGSGSWFRTFTDWMNVIVSHEENVFDALNCSSSGKRLGDGWAYRNFDHGFFKNSAYGNKAPNVCYLAMGANDNDIIDSIGFDKYLFMFE